MKKTLLLGALLGSFAASAQIQFQSYAEYDAIHGEKAALEKQSKYIIQSQDKRISRPAIPDILTYRLYKEAEKSGFLKEITGHAGVSLFVEMGPDKAPQYILYKPHVYIRTENEIRSEELVMTPEQVEEFKSLVLKTFAGIDFEKLAFPESTFSMGLNFVNENKKEGDVNTYLKNLPDTTSKINLSGYGLREVPAEIYRFDNLKELNLVDNQLEKLPRKLWKIESLERLQVSRNLLTNRSLKIRKNEGLKSLNVQFNYITKAPSKIHRLKGVNQILLGNNTLTDFQKQKFKKAEGIQILNLYNAGLHDLPASMNDLTGLQELDLYYNNLKTLDLDFSQLKNLKTLAVSHNGLWKLPEELSTLNSLEVLYAHHNKLNRLPELSTPIRILDLGYNDFTEVPAYVANLKTAEQVDFSNCRLERVPSAIGEIPNLKKVFVSNNPVEEDHSEEYNAFVNALEKRSVTVR